MVTFISLFSIFLPEMMGNVNNFGAEKFVGLTFVYSKLHVELGIHNARSKGLCFGHLFILFFHQ